MTTREKATREQSASEQSARGAVQGRLRKSLLPTEDMETENAEGVTTRNVAAQAEEVSWGDAAADFIRQVYGTKERKTQMFYAGRLRVLSRWAEGQGVALAAFRVRHLREYLAQRAGEVSGRTVRHDAVAARCFLRFCAQEGYTPGNALAGFAIPKAARAYVKCPSDDEVRRLLSAMQERWKVSGDPACRFAAPKVRTFLGRRNYAIIAGLVETACRIGEMLALKVEDVNITEKQIVIRRAKGDRPRVLPVSDAFLSALAAWLRVRPACACDRLFITEYGDAMTGESFSRQFGKYLSYAGLSGFTLHGLRHYALTQIARTDLQAAMHIAGHSSLLVTQGYLHAGADHVRAAHALAAPLTRLLTGGSKSVLVNTRSETAKRRRLV